MFRRVLKATLRNQLSSVESQVFYELMSCLPHTKPSSALVKLSREPNDVLREVLVKLL